MQLKHPGRFYGLAGPDLRRPGALDLFKRGIEEYGLRGLKVIPGNGYYVWDEKLYPFYEACLDYDVPIFVCTQAHFGGYTRARFQDPIHIGDVICDFPDLKIVLLHAGHPFQDWFEKCIWMASHAPNVYLQFDFWVSGYRAADMDTRQAFVNRRFDEEGLVKMLSQAKAVVGTHRMLWGTDSMHGPRMRTVRHAPIVEWWKSLPEIAKKYGHEFTQEDVDLILGDNVARVLKITDEPEWRWQHKYGWRRRYPAPYRGVG